MSYQEDISLSEIPDENSLTITDNRTGKQYTVRLQEGQFLKATDLRQIKVNGDDSSGVVCFDPGYMNTAAARSQITYIDGENGILRYRGYDIEDLVANSSFLEVAFLLIYGELPSENQYKDWTTRITRHTFVHENLVQLMKTFRYDAHPMGMLISSVSALSTFYDEANPALRGTNIFANASVRNKQIFRILGKLPTIAAISFRHRIGRPYNNPVNHLGYTENFLYMMDRLSETDYRPHPKLAKALDVLFIIHADHELNCSTAAMRHLSSTLVDPYTSVAGAAAALYGPLHGGANEAVLRMLEEIGTVENIPTFLADVKAKKRKLMGFGHRIYKNYDPRAKILKKVAEEVFEVVGRTPLMEVAGELERQALADQYFVSRRLYPNVDFYSGVIYKAMGFPTDMFPVLFTIPRAAGWIAHWVEQLDDPETKIWRPRQMYVGPERREFVPMTNRENNVTVNLEAYMSEHARRRLATDDDRAARGDNINN